MDNTQGNIRQIQQDLREAGFYAGRVDGIWGDKSKAALKTALETRDYQATCGIDASQLRPVDMQIAWGSKVSKVFKERIIWIADDLEMPAHGADWLMSCIAWESASTFSASIKNMAGSGAVGLIQFMPKTAIGLGTTVSKLALMTPEAQLNYVAKYFAPYRGKLNSLSDVYMTILWPLGVGKSEDYVLWDQHTRPTTYRQNIGLDVNRDLKITKGEAASKVMAELLLGQQFRG